MKKLILIFLLISAISVIAATSPYARRIRPVTSLPACTENEIAFNMTTHLGAICDNVGYKTILTVGGGGTSADPQFNSLGLGQAAGGVTGSIRTLLNVAGIDGAIIKNSNSGGGTVVQVVNDTPTTFNFQANGSANASSTLLNISSSGLINGAFAGGITIVANNAAGIIRFGTGGGLNTSERWRIDNAGNLLSQNNSSITSQSYLTNTNCLDSAGAAACGSATAGSFVIDAATTSTVVSTTAITANSQIFIQNDSSLGTRLSVTCNTQSSLVLGTPRITARTTGTSFTVTIEVGPTTNPMCLNYHIVN